ncbi:MAG: PH domain-containing protein [Bacillota bacterium]|jgi:hypothetical protein
MFRRRSHNPVLTLLSLAILGCILLWTAIAGKYEYLLDDTGVTITRGRGITIAYDEITDLQYFEQLPKLSMRVGESIGNKRNGTFTVAGVGRGKVYAQDITRSALIIFTEDTFYAITPENAQEFMAQIQEHLPDK